MTYKNILVPLDGGKASLDVIELVCSFQKVAQATIHAVFVIEVPRNLPLDADMPEKVEFARSILNRVSNLAQGYDVVLHTAIVYARSTGEVIVSTASDLNCDVIAIAQDNHKLSIIPDAAATIYHKAKCHVWMFNFKA